MQVHEVEKGGLRKEVCHTVFISPPLKAVIQRIKLFLGTILRQVSIVVVFNIFQVEITYNGSLSYFLLLIFLDTRNNPVSL